MSIPPLFVAAAALACLMFLPEVGVAGDDNLPASVNRVERETGGRVLSAERRNQSGRQVNRIKVYTPEGKVRVMWDRPQSSTREEPAQRQQRPVRQREPAQRNDRR